jgi:prophage tail gpP-like protein
MPELFLFANGKRFEGWTETKVTLSMQRMSNAFELTYTEKWSEQHTPWPLNRGDSCTLKMAGKTVITGYIDDVLPSFSATERTMRVTGRDKTGDLVDCSVVHDTGQFKNQTLLQIAQVICKPFGIPVSATTSVGDPFKKFTIQQGETVFESLDRAARQRGVLLVTDGKGGLLITRASTKKISSALIEGENILEGSAVLSNKERFSVYKMKGENQGSNMSTPEQNTQTVAEAKDPGVTRYRPLIVITEQQGDKTALTDRALWEASVRKGRGSKADLTVEYWAHEGGLWRPNMRVPVRSETLKIDQEMLISDVTLILDGEGERARLTLCLPGSFELIPLPEPDKEKVL